MSDERDYRLYVKQYHGGINEKGEVDLSALIAKYQIPHGDARDRIDDRRLRTAISVRLGKVEESKHGTFQDPDTKQRRNHVPNRIAAFHNKLVDQLYNAVTPPEPPVTSTSDDVGEALDLG